VSEPLEEVTVRPRAARPDVLRFGEMADQELDRVLLNLQPDLRNTQLATVDISATRAGQALEAAASTPARPALNSLASMNAYLESIGSRQFGIVIDDPALLNLLAESETPAARAADAATVARIRAEQAAIDVIPEVVATASRFAIPEVLVSAARVLGGTPFGLASMIVEGAYTLGSYLSPLALQNAIGRISPPPIVPSLPGGGAFPPAPAPSRGDIPDEPFPDRPLTVVTVPGARPPQPLAPVFPVPTFINPPLSFVTPGDLATPGPLDRPVNLPVPAPRPVPAPTPSPFTFADPLLFTPTPTPTSSPTPFGAPAPTPTGLPGPFSAPTPFGAPSPSPNTPDLSSRCPPCSRRDPKKKKKKRKPREVCYRGTYYESATSLTKYRKEQIPCQRSK
jgi:hypothetical protein